MDGGIATELNTGGMDGGIATELNTGGRDGGVATELNTGGIRIVKDVGDRIGKEVRIGVSAREGAEVIDTVADGTATVDATTTGTTIDPGKLTDGTTIDPGRLTDGTAAGIPRATIVNMCAAAIYLVKGKALSQTSREGSQCRQVAPPLREESELKELMLEEV